MKTLQTQFFLCIWSLWSICCFVYGDNIDHRCNSNNIYVNISDSFLAENKIDVANPTQLHFRNYPKCLAKRTERGYILRVDSPYDTCGMTVEHTGNKFIYRNEVVFSSPKKFVTILSFKCEYDDKYVVSSPMAITPKVRTLNFATSYGTLRVGMALYQRKDFNPKSRLGDQPTVVVGVPVYVSVDMDDIFASNDIVTSLETCYTTTSEDSVTMDTYHFLITDRCASPSDTTVRIFQNGLSRESRFVFQMFQWKKSRSEYIYLHCRVQICNTTSQICTGQGPLCNNAERSEPGRAKRELSDRWNFQDLSGFLTYGPIAMAKEMGVGKPSLEMKLAPKQNQEFLTTVVLATVFGTIFLICVILIVVVVAKRRRHNRKTMTSEKSSCDVSVTDSQAVVVQRNTELPGNF